MKYVSCTESNADAAPLNVGWTQGLDITARLMLERAEYTHAVGKPPEASMDARVSVYFYETGRRFEKEETQHPLDDSTSLLDWDQPFALMVL